MLHRVGVREPFIYSFTQTLEKVMLNEIGLVQKALCLGDAIEKTRNGMKPFHLFIHSTSRPIVNKVLC